MPVKLSGENFFGEDLRKAGISAVISIILWFLSYYLFLRFCLWKNYLIEIDFHFQN